MLRVIPTVLSSIVPKPLHSTICMTKPVVLHSIIVPVLTRTRLARMPLLSAQITSQHRTSISTISFSQRIIRSLRRPSRITFKIAKSRHELALRSNFKIAAPRWMPTLYIPATVGLPHLSNRVHSVGSPNPQTHAVSSLPSAKWYRVAFKCSFGRVTAVRAPPFDPTISHP